MAGGRLRRRRGERERNATGRDNRWTGALLDLTCYGTVTARSEYTHLTRPHMRHGACARWLAALRMVWASAAWSLDDPDAYCKPEQAERPIKMTASTFRATGIPVPVEGPSQE